MKDVRRRRRAGGRMLVGSVKGQSLGGEKKVRKIIRNLKCEGRKGKERWGKIFFEPSIH